ncbi:glycosyltransferase [Caldibacillus lycopersici]|uniref:Glycosyltransferase n=1 Tax=Perspicuibacillus lycopersici TaxID=1325689 RepID=A0AAE3LRE5_9BACI|nr:glycosyltransferase family 2 protein [Perspicuibacillus lycopersici]MCU9614559.1 glycosyltransferase [Perspicuibacillus lycopersici]
MFNIPFTFKGNEFLSFSINRMEVADSFSYRISILPDSQYNAAAFPFIIAPDSTEKGAASVGVVVNGHEIKIIEYGDNHYHTVILAHVDTSTWVDLVLVYLEKKPFLYINGRLIAQGNKSNYTHIYPSRMIGGNEKGECFKGKIRAIQLWKESFSHEKIVQMKEYHSNTFPHSLIWSRDFLSGVVYKNGSPFNPKVTVIMPTYNKYQDILMTLHSLECQTFNKREFEIIICDDGSQDNTFQIPRDSAFSYSITYIRSNHNIGRPNMRNLGLQAASGEIIVFLDAEIIVKPDFIDIHYQAHKKKDRLVVSGSLVLHGVYTRFYPEYNEMQKKQLTQIVQNNPYQRFNVQEMIKNNKRRTLLTKENVYDQSYIHYSFEKPFVPIYRDTIFKTFGNELIGFQFPWILFCTGNVSAKAEGFREVGLFEEYPGYGWDDHEMGYRLYKKGYSFINHTSLIGYHQEHPVAASNQMDAMRNFVRMFRKYKEVEMRVFALHFLGIGLPQINSILEAFQYLQENDPTDYLSIKGLFQDMLQSIARRLWNGEKITNLTEGSKFHPELAKSEANRLMNNERIKPFLLIFHYLLTI